MRPPRWALDTRLVPLGEETLASLPRPACRLCHAAARGPKAAACRDEGCTSPGLETSAPRATRLCRGPPVRALWGSSPGRRHEMAPRFPVLPTPAMGTTTCPWEARRPGCCSPASPRVPGQEAQHRARGRSHGAGEPVPNRPAGRPPAARPGQRDRCGRRSSSCQMPVLPAWDASTPHPEPACPWAAGEAGRRVPPGDC